MKRKKRLALSALAGFAAAAIALMAIGDVRAEAARTEQEALARYGGDLTAVCVATRGIDPGERIDEGNVEVVEWVSSMLPVDAVTSLKDAVGKTSTSRIPAGAPLSSVYFERRESALEIPQGKVAVSVSSDAEHAVGGVLERGEIVDVYLSRDALADRLAQAEVLNTSTLANGGGDVSWVILAVDPEAVKELLVAASQGTVWLVIPNADVEGGTDGAITEDIEKDASVQDANASEGKQIDLSSQVDGDVDADAASDEK